MLEWNPSISVNDATIDSQHQKLLHQINVLLETIRSHSEKEKTEESLKFLDDYINDHLAYEEVYMKKHQYPAYKEHKQIHQTFKKRYKAFKIELKTESNEVVTNNIENFLANWWWNHISVEDQKYQDYIELIGKVHLKKESENFHQTIQS
ncbi:hemerythrin [Candidatus Uhrbacteria bacterium CG_4_9_14_3_um_filter_41_35]|uniref:Hemerythrin n=1 Tax=Candidatus Uhrbacteria bacterium CG_4_9_14_3_um_filter_41_35 TaxID=1975034 RepID=A0A2M7XGC3_9BACT|nr:MAG: hemerythrin [Candidatus Uhrbacteria bacterium CG_4_9_14_3_um_filter_41_35]